MMQFRILKYILTCNNRYLLSIDDLIPQDCRKDAARASILADLYYYAVEYAYMCLYQVLLIHTLQ